MSCFNDHTESLQTRKYIYTREYIYIYKRHYGKELIGKKLPPVSFSNNIFVRYDPEVLKVGKIHSAHLEISTCSVSSIKKMGNRTKKLFTTIQFHESWTLTSFYCLLLFTLFLVLAAGSPVKFLPGFDGLLPFELETG